MSCPAAATTAASWSVFCLPDISFLAGQMTLSQLMSCRYDSSGSVIFSHDSSFTTGQLLLLQLLPDCIARWPAAVLRTTGRLVSCLPEQLLPSR